MCDCTVEKQPIFYRNPDTKEVEVNILVCPICLEESTVPPITRAQWYAERRAINSAGRD